MIDRILEYIAPHLCYECRKTGTILCESCKFSIVSENSDACLRCGFPSPSGICGSCKSAVHYEKAWCIGERRETLKRIIDDYKFSRVKAGGQVLAQLLNECLPQLPASTVVVPIPTISAHIRYRGYDHCLLIAKIFARQRQLTLAPLLSRQSRAVQHHVRHKKQRYEQAASAFALRSRLSPDVPYLVIDDIVTTGATIEAAAQIMYSAGARHIWVGTIARQPLDKHPTPLIK